ncbi:MAG: hypothetical protein IJV98_04000 [Clostridia bacterium]|nr:hypothetical protein [Clostridia bacterium]
MRHPVISCTDIFILCQNLIPCHALLSAISYDKKAGSARLHVLAYLSFPRRQARHNGEVDFEQFPMAQKAGNARRRVLAYRSFPRRQARQNGEVDFEQFPMVKKGAVSLTKIAKKASPV